MEGTMYLLGGIPTIGKHVVEVEQEFDWDFMPTIGMTLRFWFDDIHYETQVMSVVVNISYSNKLESYLTVELDPNIRIKQRVDGYPRMQVDEVGTTRIDDGDLVEILRATGWMVPKYDFEKADS